MEEKYFEFLRIAKNLNNKLELIPLLYGSLGLQKITEIEFNPDDIDILISEKYLNEQWNRFKEIIEELGYELIDLHEHAFFNGKYKIAFASIESLESFAGINLQEIEKIKEEDSSYQILNLSQYLKVYEQSSKDSYRRDKNNNKDLLKIKTIKKLIEQKK